MIFYICVFHIQSGTCLVWERGLYIVFKEEFNDTGFSHADHKTGKQNHSSYTSFSVRFSCQWIWQCIFMLFFNEENKKWKFYNLVVFAHFKVSLKPLNVLRTWCWIFTCRPYVRWTKSFKLHEFFLLIFCASEYGNVFLVFFFYIEKNRYETEIRIFGHFCSF